MKNKKIDDDLEEIDDEVIDDEIIDDEIINDEIIDDEEIVKKESSPKTKGRKNKKKKGKAIAIVISIVAALLIIALVAWFVIVPLFNKGSEGTLKTVDDIDYSLMLANYETAPTAAVADSMVYDWTDILSDSTKSNEYKAAAAMLFTTGNEVFLNQYAWAKYQLGTTKLGENEGSMIYQRIRRETTDMKYDTTIKMPINHNFDALASKTVTSANIRYVNNGYYHRMSNSSDITYNETTGLLEVAEWGKESKKNWHRAETTDNSLNCYTDLRKIQANVGTLADTLEESVVNENMILDDSVKIEKKGSGINQYYSIYFEVDTVVANVDKTTTDALDNDNGGSGIKYDYCKVTLDVWSCGLPKALSISESWTGKVVLYSGTANSDSRIKYSYSDNDCKNTEYPDQWIATING